MTEIVGAAIRLGLTEGEGAGEGDSDVGADGAAAAASALLLPQPEHPVFGKITASSASDNPAL